MRLTTMGVNPQTKQASLILMSSFTGKLRHWAQQNTEAIYSLTSVTHLVDLLRTSFVIKRLRTPNPGFFRLIPYTPVPPIAITDSGHRRRRPTTYEILTALIEGVHSYLPPPRGT